LILTAGHLQATLSKLLRYPTMCSGQLNLLPSARWEMSNSLWAIGWRPSMVDWGGGRSASCNCGSSCSLMQAMDGRIYALWYH